MLRTPLDGSTALSIIVPQGAAEPRAGNSLVEFSLYLRDEMVRVIKQTMPQPNSAFLGAVTVGLRYGMQNTVSVASDDYDTLTGLVTALLASGLSVPTACRVAALANRHVGSLASPTPAWGVADLLPFLPRALERALAEVS